ncbi:hypothetical protein BGL63_07345 [Helicobacter pylori]|nr:hypothetical protein BGL63_07345 [Helicobacter pylori]
MQDFINGFLKAWKAWSDDGKDAFLESFLDEVKNSKNDPTNFLGILEQEIKSLSQEGLKDDISSMLEVIESMKNEISNTKDNENVSDFFKTTQAEIPNIFSVWDECFSSARNYIKTLSETNLDFLYTP